MPEAPVTSGELARLLGVNISTVRDWDRKGLVHGFRTPGNQRRYPWSEVERLRNPPPANDEEIPA